MVWPIRRGIGGLPVILMRTGKRWGSRTQSTVWLTAASKPVFRSVHHTPNSAGKRWEAGGFLPRMPDSLERLDLLLLTVARKRKVHPDSIRYQRLRYVDTTFAAYIGESVTLRYDPRDMA